VGGDFFFCPGLESGGRVGPSGFVGGTGGGDFAPFRRGEGGDDGAGGPVGRENPFVSAPFLDGPNVPAL